MRLFLTSRGLSHPDELARLLEVDSLAGVSAALIPNAREGRPHMEQLKDVARKREELEALGFDVFVTDLRVYRGPALAKRLAGKRLLWACGGNTFYLLYRLRESGFADVAKPLLAAGAVYGGESAGAIAVGPSLKPIVDVDEPAKAPRRLLRGLGWLPFFILPHWDAEAYRAGQGTVVAKAAALGLEVVRLKDGEALVVDGPERRLLTAHTEGDESDVRAEAGE